MVRAKNSKVFIAALACASMVTVLSSCRLGGGLSHEPDQVEDNSASRRFSPSFSKLTVSNPSVVPGGSQTVTLTAYDRTGNQMSKGGLQVAFSYSGGTTTGTFGTVRD